jgi:hypothetical protein
MGDVMRCAKIRCVVRIRITNESVWFGLYMTQDENCVPWERTPCEL